MTSCTREKNIDRFNEDVASKDGYQYSAADAKLSSKLANQRLTQAVMELVAIRGKKVLDIGCGDGAYTMEYLQAHPAFILGIDPANAAIEAARRKSETFKSIEFRTLSIYDLDQLDQTFDVAIIRGVLHHLYDVERAIAQVVRVAGELIVLEPNGYNPGVKIIEKLSTYHRDHEEKSYFPHQLDGWFARRGAQVIDRRYYGLVPFFCPDWMARALKWVEPIVEKTPLVMQLSCAVYIQRLLVDTNRPSSESL